MLEGQPERHTWGPPPFPAPGDLADLMTDAHDGVREPDVTDLEAFTDPR